MSALLVGYARCSTDQQDLTAQRDALLGLGVETERIYVDHGLTGTNRERPGLREALAAYRAGDTLVVTKLDRLARSRPGSRCGRRRRLLLPSTSSKSCPTDSTRGWGSEASRSPVGSASGSLWPGSGEAGTCVMVGRTCPRVTAHAAHGDPRDVLVDLSPAAHLVVVGSRGRGVLRSRLLGSVSTTVVRHAESPVVVCRPESPGNVRKGVLVGADGTPEGHAMLELAFQQASVRNLPLTVLHAFHDVVAAVNGPHLIPATAGLLEEQRLLLAESVAGFSEKFSDVWVDVQLARGFAHECLSAASEQWHLIVVGRHPTDSLSRMVSSTVATAVVERAHTTVAVVPVPAPV